MKTEVIVSKQCMGRVSGWDKAVLKPSENPEEMC